MNKAALKTKAVEGLQKLQDVGVHYLQKLEKSNPLFRPYLGQADLERLKLYQYRSGGYTKLDNFLSEYWWTPLGKHVPAWVHPNTLTVIALACSFFLSTIPFIIYSPNFQTPCPRWIHFIVCVGMILYQTLDAIDGKQARRTGLSSPIGQMMDHGCDSLTTTYSIFMICATLRIGNGPMMALMVGAMTFQLLMYSWWEHAFGYFRACTGEWFGVTEGQMCIILGNAACVFDPNIFNRTIGSVIPLPIVSYLLSGLTLGIPVRYFMYAFGCGIIVMLSVNDVRSLFTDSPPPRKHQAVKEWAVLGFHVYCCMALVIGGVISRNPFFATTALAAATSLITWRMIVATVAKSELYAYQWPTLPFWVVAALCSCNVLPKGLETFAVALTALWSSIALAVFVYVNMKLMRDYLGVPMFVVPEINQKYALGLVTEVPRPRTEAKPSGAIETNNPVSEAVQDEEPQPASTKARDSVGTPSIKNPLIREQTAIEPPMSPELFSPVEGKDLHNEHDGGSEDGGRTDGGRTIPAESPIWQQEA